MTRKDYTATFRLTSGQVEQLEQITAVQNQIIKERGGQDRYTSEDLFKFIISLGSDRLIDELLGFWMRFYGLREESGQE